MQKKNFIFWFDLVYCVGLVIGFFLQSDASRPVFIQLVTTAIMPILGLLNAGISGSIIMDKKVQPPTNGT